MQYSWKTGRRKPYSGRRRNSAAMNTASEYGFGAVIAALPGFWCSQRRWPPFLIHYSTKPSHHHTCRNYRFSVRRDEYCSSAMSDTFIAAAHAANIPLEVFTAWHLWPVAAWIHCPITALDHPAGNYWAESPSGLRRHLPITIIKSLAVLFIIGVYYTTALSKENHHEFTR